MKKKLLFLLLILFFSCKTKRKIDFPICYWNIIKPMTTVDFNNKLFYNKNLIKLSLKQIQLNEFKVNKETEKLIKNYILIKDTFLINEINDNLLINGFYWDDSTNRSNINLQKDPNFKPLSYKEYMQRNPIKDLKFYCVGSINIFKNINSILLLSIENKKEHFANENRNINLYLLNIDMNAKLKSTLLLSQYHDNNDGLSTLHEEIFSTRKKNKFKMTYYLNLRASYLPNYKDTGIDISKINIEINEDGLIENLNKKQTTFQTSNKFNN